ncbi:MAG: hypothetical protein K6G58_07785, partial [Lachnospiraceae bacterium]|nr:hypothetical protein [Lachnospiraceae bacterium]
MAPDNRPRSREKKTIEGVGNVQKRGSGLDSKPITSTSSGSRPSGGGMKRSGGIGFGTIILIAIVYFLFFRGGSGGASDAGPGGSQNQTQQAGQTQQTLPQSDAGDVSGGNTQAGGMGDIFGTLLGGYTTS